MPKIVRQVEQEVGDEEAIADLQKFAEAARQPALTLPDGSLVNTGDALTPDPEQAPQVMEGTHILVLSLVEGAAVFYGAFFAKDSSRSLGFFPMHAVTGRFQAAPVAKKAAKSKKA